MRRRIHVNKYNLAVGDSRKQDKTGQSVFSSLGFVKKYGTFRPELLCIGRFSLVRVHPWPPAGPPFSEEVAELLLVQEGGLAFWRCVCRPIHVQT